MFLKNSFLGNWSRSVGVCAVLIMIMSSSTAFSQAIVGSDSNSIREPSERVGVLLEPSLLVSREDSAVRTSQLPLISDDTSGRSDSAGFGMRVGTHAMEALFIGADGRYSRFQWNDSSYGGVKGNTYNLGATVGWQMPWVGLRLWGTYVLWGESDPEAGNSGFDARFTNPRGGRLGAGFRLGAVSVNLEYQDLTYGTTEIQSYGVIDRSGSSEVDFETRGYVASLSFPIEL